MTKWWALVFLVGCGDNQSGQPGQPGQPDAGEPEIDASAGARIKIGGTVHSFDVSKPLDATQPVLPGAEVCIYEDGEPHCATTAADGRWEMDGPANAGRLEYTTTAPGHLSVYEVYFTRDADELEGRLFMGPDALVSSYLQSCGVGYDLKTGVLVKGFRYTPPDDYTYLDGAVASATGGDGPCYMAAPWIYDPAQQTTTAAGTGVLVFGEVPAGAQSVDLTVTLAGATCSAYLDLVDNLGPNQMRIPVRPGFQTLVNVVCE